MPNQLSVLVEQRIVAFCLGHPGPRVRGGSRRGWRARSGAGCWSSPNGVYKTLVRHGLNTRAKRLALVAGYRAPYEPPREPPPEPHIDSTGPGELVGIDCFFVGRLHGSQGPVWQITAIDTYSSFAWADLVVTPRRRPDRRADLRARPPRRRRAPTRRLAAGTRAHRQRQRVRPPARSPPAARTASRTARSGPGARRPTGTSNACTARSSKNAGGPRSRATCTSASAACAATSPRYLHDYNHDREHHGRITAGRRPADLVYGARKMEPR